MGSKTLLALAVAVGLAAGAGAGRADTIQLIGISGTGGGPVTYHFELELTPNNGLTNDASWQSGIVVMDFPGFVSAAKVSNLPGEVTLAGDWALSTTGTGAVLPNSAFAAGVTKLFGSSGLGTDFVSLADGADMNIVMAYTGAVLGGSGSQRNLIGLDIVSTAVLSASDVINTMSRDTNTTSGKIGEVETFSTVIPVPLPAAAWAGLSTLAGLGAVRLLKRRR